MSSLLSGVIGLAILLVLGGLKSAQFTLAESAIIVMVPLTVFLLVVAFGRLTSPGEPWSSQILDLNSSPVRKRPMDIEQLIRRSAHLHFSAWKPDADVTIH